MEGMSLHHRALAALVRRRVAAGGGRLAYVDERGEVHDLGAYTVAQIVALDTATQIAYRATPIRSERVRLAAIRLVSGRLAQAARRVEAK